MHKQWRRAPGPQSADRDRVRMVRGPRSFAAAWQTASAFVAFGIVEGSRAH
jgi:hypothetical protein